MSTAFKVGDRVKLTGEAWKDNEPEMYRRVVEVTRHHENGNPAFIFDGVEWYIYCDEHGDWSATLVEPAAPAPDTRKRLREYTDLADGDVVVIAGVALTARAPVPPDAIRVWNDERTNAYPVTNGALADMLVDEVHRKPKTRRRLLFDEVVDAKEAGHGDIVMDKHGHRSILCDQPVEEGEVVFRLVEETEVPR